MKYRCTHEGGLVVEVDNAEAARRFAGHECWNVTPDPHLIPPELPVEERPSIAPPAPTFRTTRTAAFIPPRTAVAPEPESEPESEESIKPKRRR